MKQKTFKNIVLATATLSTLAACQHNNILIDREISGVELKQPEKDHLIEFATFADRNTRAAATVNDLEFYHATFKVYGTKTSHNGATIQPLFEGVTVTANIAEDAETPNTWEYETDRYWDKQADYYQFIAFAPAHAPLAYQHNLVEVNHKDAGFFTPSEYSLIGQNLQQGDPSDAEKNTGFTGEENTDCDVMRSAPFVVNDPKTTPVVTLNFSHTLAKLLVTVKANAAAPYVITINKVSVSDLYSTGIYKHATGWETYGNAVVDYEFTYPATDLSATSKTYFIESLTMPQDITSDHIVRLDYTITSGTYTEQFTYTTTLAEVFNGKATKFAAANSYIVNFNIAPEKNIITFDTGVTEWTENDSEIIEY